MARTSTALLCVALALLAGAHAQESLTLAPSNATGPFGTQVTGSPKGFASTSLTTTTLGPCVLRNLHTHAATELLYVVGGSILSVQFAENGSTIASTLTAGGNNGTSPSAVVYPVGREHLQYNPTCEPASFAAFFGVNPPGIATVNLNATRLMSAVDKATTASPEAVTAQEGALKEIMVAAATPIPAGYSGAGPFTPAAAATFAFPLTAEAQAMDACLARCGLSLSMDDAQVASTLVTEAGTGSGTLDGGSSSSAAGTAGSGGTGSAASGAESTTFTVMLGCASALLAAAMTALAV